jgi:hypothetical protein
MPKPNEKFTVKQMKDYIRTHSLNKKIKLTQKKADLISALKKEGHWEEKPTPKKVTPKPTPKKATPKKTTKKEYTITTNPDTFNQFDTDFYVNGDPFITYLQEKGWELQMNTKMGQGARFTKNLTKQEYDKFKKQFSKWFKSNQYKLE